MDTPNQGTESGTNRALIILCTLAVALLLSWAVATFFEIAFAKALAAVVMVLFGVFVALLLAGLTP